MNTSPDLERRANELLEKLLERLTLDEILTLTEVKTGNFVVDTKAALVREEALKRKVT